jgi:parallel beta helix pectate lyase-like protein
MSRRLIVLAAAVLGTTLFPVESRAQGLPGRVTDLERRAAEAEARLAAAEGRLTAVEARVAELAGASAPLALSVDCPAGQTVTAALAGAAGHLGPVTITIHGQCVESVTVSQDNVTLQGGVVGDGLTAPAGARNLLTLGAVRGIALRRLTLDGAGTARGLSASRGSAFVSFDLTVRNATFGVVVAAGGQGSLVRARVEDNSLNGVEAEGTLAVQDSQITRNSGAGLRVEGRADVSGTALDDNGTGLRVYLGGIVVTDGGSVTNSRNTGVAVELGSTALLIGTGISGSGFVGLQALGGSSVEVDAPTIIENNGSTGVQVMDGSVVRLASSPGRPVTVRNNRGDGFFLDDTSTVQASSETLVSGNDRWGVFCSDPPAVAMVQGGFSAATVTGNGAGQIHCPGLMVP